MKVINKIICLMAAALVLLSGCSYKRFEDYLNAKRSGLVTVTDPGGKNITDANGDPEYFSPDEMIVTPEMKTEDVSYVKVGEEFNDWHYVESIFDSSVSVHGTEGLKYTVNSVEFYNTFDECGIDKSECSSLAGMFIGKDNINFVVVSMTAVYENPTDDPALDTVYPKYNWIPSYRWGAAYKYNEPIPEGVYPPELIYFSEHIVTERYDELNDIIMTMQYNYGWYENPISDGESVDFKIGIAVEDWFTERKNLFLTFHGVPQPNEPEPQVYVDLLGRFSDDE